MGVIKALRRIHPVEIDTVKVARRTPLQDIWSWIRYLLAWDASFSVVRDHHDVMIGTGSHTHIPMLSGKRYGNALVCTCMAPAWMLRRRFDLCFVPRHDGIAAGKNIFLTFGPPNCSEAGEGHDQKKGLILLGGTDTKSHLWNSTGIIGYVQDLIVEEAEKEWTIASSPRTPEETVSLIEGIARQFPNVRFFKFQDTESGWIERQYYTNKTVWVTADSMSMVYEALTAGCCVGILPVVWKKKKNKFRSSEETLLQRGMVVTFAAWKEGRRMWNVKEPLDEASLCAKEIVKLWYQKSSI